MKILFVHQNFPAQFKFLAPALAGMGHDVTAMAMNNFKSATTHGVKVVTHKPGRGSTPGVHPWVSDFETKAIRGEASFRTALKMREQGYTPDVIVAHPGWGESLFLKDVWPNARLGIYCEFFYKEEADAAFDPEFLNVDPGEVCRLRLKNLNNFLHFQIADAGISPTQWQASSFPEPFRSRITVVHDGIDTNAVAPNPNAQLTLNDKLTLNRGDEVITFVNRNLEPYRGYHIFMRALPELLARRPNARVIIVGGNDTSYGAKPAKGQTWREIFFSEVKDRIDASRVHFVGNVPYAVFIGMLQLSTVHVYLTYPFVLSWSLLEAMSVGCAIVASDTAPLREAIEHDLTGRLVDFFDVKALTDSVCALLDDPAARARLGAAARERAVRDYDLRTVCLPRQLEWVQQLTSS